jgi:hypothetical protein
MHVLKERDVKKCAKDSCVRVVFLDFEYFFVDKNRHIYLNWYDSGRIFPVNTLRASPLVFLLGTARRSERDSAELVYKFI